MNKFITIPLFFILFNLNAQNYYQKNYDSLNKVLETINKKINELQNQKISIEDRIKTFAERLSNKDNYERNTEFKKEAKSDIENGIVTTINGFASIMRDEPSAFGKVISRPEKGDSILVLNLAQEPYYRVSYKGTVGFMSYISFKQTYEIRALLKELELKKLGIKYGERNARRIQNQEYWIGMTDEMATLSLGKPDDINRTTYSWGVNEQWIYSKKGIYLYFTDGILTTIQD